MNKAYEELTASVDNIKLSNESAHEAMKTQMDAVLGPLTLNGTDVAVQVQAFKELLAAEEGEMDKRWQNWEEIQKELAVLGVQVLGEPEKKDGIVGNAPDGCKVQSEKWQKELEEQLKGPIEELKAAGEEAVKKLAVAEKAGAKGQTGWFGY